jgi:hypothetical protein
MSFESDYVNLLIKQYWEKPKANAEIAFKAGVWRKTFEWIDSFSEEFDLDNATGDRLDIIGRIVGISRTIPFIVPKIAFGFDENTSARGFDDKFLQVADRATFQGKFERTYTDLQLDDSAYRFFIRAKISKNVGGPYIVDDQGLSIQLAVNTLFDGLAYVIDRKDMTLNLYVSPQFNLDQLRAIIRLDLLPKPQGVRYGVIVQAGPGETFGFSDNVNALPFADKFDLTNQPGGRFANKVVI